MAVRRPKTSKERSHAKRLRAKRDAGEELSKQEQRALEAYEQDTARWEAAPAEDDKPARAPSSAPIHRVDPVAAGGPERYTAEPVLPPAATAATEPNAGSGQPSADGAAGGSGAAPAPPDPNAPPAPGPTPIVDPPPPQGPPVAELEAGARRFAGLVVAYNSFGLAALVKMFPRGALPIPAEVEELVYAQGTHAALLGAIGASAIELAHKHPWLCMLAPGPATTVIGASSITTTALWFAYLKPLLDQRKADQAAGVDRSSKSADQAKDANPRTEAPPAPPPRRDEAEAAVAEREGW